MKGLFITGTDTNVGKTYISCQIAAELHARQFSVIPKKPVESGCEFINGQLHPRDADLLLKASQANIPLEQVNTYRYAAAISPQIAAQQSGYELQLPQLIEACTADITDNDFLLVEGAGGFFSPICQGKLNADLASALQLPLVLVSNDRLGCVNQTLLAIRAIEQYRLPIHAIILNRTSAEKSHVLMDNLTEILGFSRYVIYQTGFNSRLSDEFYSQIILTGS